MENQESSEQGDGINKTEAVKGPVGFIATKLTERINQDMTIETKQERVSTEDDHLIEIDGLKMNANVQGSERPDAEVVVLLTGNGDYDPLQDFDPLVSRFKNDCRVVTIDPLGRGLSDKNPDTSRSNMTSNDIDKVLEELKTQGKIPENATYTIVAHSKSGAVGQTFAIEHPDKTNGFVGIDAYLPGQDEFIDEEYPGLIPEPKPTSREITQQKYDMRFPDSVPTVFVIPSYLRKDAPALIYWREKRLSGASDSRLLFAGKEHFAYRDPVGADAIVEATKSLNKKNAA